MPRPSRYAPDNLPRPRHWTDDAACSGTDTTAFFPASTDGVTVSLESAYAKQICASCQVRTTCLAHALTYREDYGVWGGLTQEERTEILRQARLAADRERRQRKEREKADASSPA